MARDGAASSAPGSDLSAQIGRRLRGFRQQRGETLRVVSARSGLSVGFLSQLERGQTSIGLTTLRDLAQSLGREIGEFFTDTLPGMPPATPQPVPDARTVAPAGAPTPASDPTGTPELLPDSYFTLARRSGEHTSQYISGSRTYRMLSQRALGLVLEPMLVEIAPGGRRGAAEMHHGEEFAYVLSGEVSFTVAGTTHRLCPGDSVHLASTIPHGLHNDTDAPAVVVSVVTPRLF